MVFVFWGRFPKPGTLGLHAQETTGKTPTQVAPVREKKMNQKDTLAPLAGPPDQSRFWVPESTPFLTPDLSFTFEGLEREQASMSTS